MSTTESSSSRRGRAALGLAAVALVALSACARTEPEPEAAPSTAAATALPPMDMAPFTVDVPSLDLDRVPGASVAVLEGKDPDHHGAWLQVPGAPAWTDAMASAVRGQIDAYRRDTDAGADPRLEVQPRLAVVGEDIAAARLLSTETRGTDSVSGSQVTWYSAREDRVLHARDLFTEQGWDAFRSEVRQRMENDPDVVRERLASAVDAPDLVENRRIWDAVLLLPDGSVMLEADQASMAPAAAGVLTVRIPRDTAAPWLSDLGRTATDAARTPADLRLPDRSTPTPSSTAPSTPAESSWTPEATGAPVPPLVPVPSDAAPSVDPGGGREPSATSAPTTSRPGPTTPPAPGPGPTSAPPADPEPSTPPSDPDPEPTTPSSDPDPEPTTPPSDPNPEPTTPPSDPDPEPTTPPAEPRPTTSPSDPRPSPTPPSPSAPGSPSDPEPEPSSPEPSTTSASGPGTGAPSTPGRPGVPGPPPGRGVPGPPSGVPGSPTVGPTDEALA